jgi:hypothetical protein
MNVTIDIDNWTLLADGEGHLAIANATLGPLLDQVRAESEGKPRSVIQRELTACIMGLKLILLCAGIKEVKFTSKIHGLSDETVLGADLERARQAEIALAKIAAIISGHDPSGVHEPVPELENLVLKVQAIMTERRAIIDAICDAASVSPVLASGLGGETTTERRSLADVCDVIRSQQDVIVKLSSQLLGLQGRGLPD